VLFLAQTAKEMRSSNLAILNIRQVQELCKHLGNGFVGFNIIDHCKPDSGASGRG
jgi:hypothetical protein